MPENFFFTNLHVTFRDIEGSDTGMSDTAGEDSTEETLGVVGSIVRDRSSEPLQREHGVANDGLDGPRIPF